VKDARQVEFKRAAKNPEGLLKAVGLVAVRQAQNAFKEQGFEGGTWPEAYEGREPRVRVANLVGSLLAGAKPPDRVLQGRPAGQYSNALVKSLNFRVVSSSPDGGTVEAGSWEDHANHFQRGGRSSQPVTPAVKAGLKKWLDKQDPKNVRAARKRVHALKAAEAKLRDERAKKVVAARARIRGDGSAGAKSERRAIATVAENIDAQIEGLRHERRAARRRVKEEKSPLRAALGFLFGIDELTTNARGRQFIGVTKKLEETVAREIEGYFARGGA